MTDVRAQHVRIQFRLVRGADGYPPMDIEGLWAKQLDREQFEIDNIPFFVREIAVGDVITADRAGSELWFRAVVSRSGHSTIRIIIYQKHLSAMREIVEQRLASLQCSYEGSGIAGLIAVDIPPVTNLDTVLDFLDDLQGQSVLTYETGLLMG